MPETKKKLAVPAVLAIAVLATACGNAPVPVDAGQRDAAVADAGCIPPQEYDPASGTCILIV